MILNALWTMGPASASQLAGRTGLTQVQVARRLPELEAAGKARPTEQTRKTAQETQLMLQKVATEKAQTVGANVDADSVVGRQKTLYKAQSDGFVRNAEQQAAKILVDTWNVRRTTDEGTTANTLNALDDNAVGKAVAMLLAGVGVSYTPTPPLVIP
jgi:predicted ArsR family transcriptional regulator